MLLVVESAAIEESSDGLAAKRVTSSDTAALLPGVDTAPTGGVAGLPSIHGLGDDRLHILVNGVPVAAACPMHMNPPLSYIDPTNVAHIDVLPGATPVSFGGDSLGGTILIESAAPRFATTDALYRDGRAATFFRSNADALGVAAQASLATDALSFRYDGSGVVAQDYRDGTGQRINASRFETSNQQISAAYRRGDNLYQVQGAVQYMPYEGFPNADMDLTQNVGTFINAGVKGNYAWGELNINLYYDRIRHQMNGNAPDRFPPNPIDISSMGLMPTQQRAQDFGYRAKASITSGTQDTLRVGSELHEQTLDDRWPGAPIGMMFDYVNINHGTRTQLGAFAEWERRWDSQWTTLLGARDDVVWMNAGAVQGYDGVDPTAAAFNEADRSRTDNHVEFTWLSRFQPNDVESFGLGLARKTRSPNFYERYAWGTNTMGMVTWFGDGNGYTGNPSLKPETAYTASVSGAWHDVRARRWDLKVTPYYTQVEDYIGVLPLCGPQCSGMPASQLQFENHRARIYGVDVTGAYILADGAAGVLRLTSSGGLVRGQDLSTHTNLYHMMPLNEAVAVEHSKGPWSSALELRAVTRKSAVDDTRNEPETSGYAILNFRAAFESQHLRADIGVTNLLDRQYENPLGGTWQSALYPPGYSGTTFRPLPAPGRSFDAGVAIKF